MNLDSELSRSKIVHNKKVKISMLSNTYMLIIFYSEVVISWRLLIIIIYNNAKTIYSNDETLNVQ
jgi:hypothetical protein